MKVAFFASAIALSVASGGHALGAVLYSGTPLHENFDSLPTSGESGVFPNDGTPTLVPGETGWVGARLGGSSTAAAVYRDWHLPADTSTGSIVGAATASTDTERALGTLTSASHQTAIGVEIVNDSAAPLTSVRISFTQERWRRPGAGAGLTVGEVNVTVAEYGTTATGIDASNLFSASSGYSTVASLNLVSAPPLEDPENPANHLGAEGLDGNLVENRVMVSALIDLSAAPVAIGESFFLRFIDEDSLGADGITAIDDFSFSTLTPGDFNGDGNVDGADFVIWQTNFPNNSGLATLATGDANGDGNVDGADFVVWQTNFPFNAGSVSPVPEPASALLVAMFGGCALVVRCWYGRFRIVPTHR